MTCARRRSRQSRDERRRGLGLAELVSASRRRQAQGGERELVEGLVKRGDARLLAAYDVYVDSQDDDLVDTILRVARRDPSSTPKTRGRPGLRDVFVCVNQLSLRVQGLHAIDATPARWRAIGPYRSIHHQPRVVAEST